MAKKKKKPTTLGLDPFADLGDLDWGISTSLDETTDETTSLNEEISPDETASLDEIEDEAIPPDETNPLDEVVSPDEVIPFNEMTLLDNEVNVVSLDEMDEMDEMDEIDESTLLSNLTHPDSIDGNSLSETPSSESAQSSEVSKSSELSDQPAILDELIAEIDQEIEQSDTTDIDATLPGETGDRAQYVIFTLAGGEYAVSIDSVTEVGRPLQTTPVPNVPDWVLGVANLRGDIISMVDLRDFLGMDMLRYKQYSRMLVSQARQEDLTIGLLVDRVSGIRYLSLDKVMTPTAPIEDRVAPYLMGVYEYEEKFLNILDFDKLLLSSEMQQFQPM
jgi:purine-binding chemotaxis protein CheW